MVLLLFPLLAQEVEQAAPSATPAKTEASNLGEGEDQGIPVKNGKAVVDSVAFPVFKGIKIVDKSSFRGIRYEVIAKNHKAAMGKAKKIKAFYVGKIIDGAKIGKFKKFGSPERNIWFAVGKSKGKQRLVGIFVHEHRITVHVMPDGDSDSMITLM